jgi:hypothetical protein
MIPPDDSTQVSSGQDDVHATDTALRQPKTADQLDLQARRRVRERLPEASSSATV